jgi:Xaa-Pro aminopeptidase
MDSYSAAAAWKGVDWKKLTQMNIQRVRSLMKEEGVDALFIHHYDNFQYVTGYMNPIFFQSKGSPLRQGAIVLADREQPIMLIGAPDYYDAKNFYWIEDVRSMPARFERWPEIIKNAISDYGLKKGKMALDPHSLFTLIDSVKEQLGKGWNFLSAGSILAKARAIKNHEEIKVMRQAAAISTAMVVTARDAVKEGVREIDVALAAEATMARLDPLAHVAFKTVVMSGERGACLDRIPSYKVIGNGEMVNIDAGCYHLGYLSEFGREVMVGKPTAEQKKVYRAGHEALMEAVKALGPGVKGSTVDRIARDVIASYGLQEFQHPHYTGHGHGLMGHDLPIIGDPGQTTDVTIEPGMVVAIEPGVFKPGVGGVREEDIVLITDTGHEVLSLVGYETKLLE